MRSCHQPSGTRPQLRNLPANQWVGVSLPRVQNSKGGSNFRQPRWGIQHPRSLPNSVATPGRIKLYAKIPNSWVIYVYPAIFLLGQTI